MRNVTKAILVIIFVKKSKSKEGEEATAYSFKHRTICTSITKAISAIGKDPTDKNFYQKIHRQLSKNNHAEQRFELNGQEYWAVLDRYSVNQKQE